jgi:hypothetical protein
MNEINKGESNMSKIKINLNIEIDRNELGINKDKPVQFFTDWYKGFIEQGTGVKVIEINGGE